ncbi:3',5'-cyclic-nucleotide phosphodiesterase [Hylemonella gracilis]|uniref:3',5'-cyclic-nucleotide phosphodiesterase n=1 Tax=Hylemonella gracilis TaxID=80880 RepID=A0A4P6UIX5_9BURK|nr:3',5'-cyclic-nucleotide phosphodiesterase [Hylemonella gracilis]QBK04015.1 3',5'-cyclic-nucleotide phosphodiesterase [Hylemonella gracilis]
MKVRVLGCSGAIARGSRTTSFLVDTDILVDAGTGVGDLTVGEMLRIDHVFITHAHLDHITALPLMLDAMGARRREPVMVHALPKTIEALRAHIFNNLIWPDFSRIPSEAAPFMRFAPIETGEVVEIGDRRVEALPAQHTVPAVGYAVSVDSAGRKDGRAATWVFSGDTGPNPAFWRRVNQLDDVRMLVIETAFSRRESKLAEISQHLAPDTLAQELAQIAPGKDYPIYITHTKPTETVQILVELGGLQKDSAQKSGAAGALARGGRLYELHGLQAGQEFDL